jgi:hypothetical protein
MTVLSRLTKLGGAKESTQYTYLAPTFSIPFNTASYEDMIGQLRDESVRATDTVLQGIQQGTWNSTWDMEVNGYADVTGNWLRAIIGPDTVTAGVSTTLSSSVIAGATSISVAASITSGSTVQIGGTSTEYAVTGTPSGSGPYTIPIVTPATGLKYAHASTSAVISQSVHTFKQNRTFATTWPTYSFTTDDGATGDQIGWPGCVCSELAIKIDPKGFVTCGPKWTGFPSISEATFAYAASTVQPVVGWAWTVTNAGASSTRGLTMDITLKRAVEPIFSSDGTQAPREVFPGALETDGTYKAIFENSTDMNLYIQASQLPTVHTLTQPLASGGAILAITMSQSGYTSGKRDIGQPYVQADFGVSAITNSTDATSGGVVSAVLSNFATASY